MNINPFSPYYIPKQPNPPITNTTAHAKNVLGQFDANEADILYARGKAQDELSAIQDVLTQNHPELATDLETLSLTAQRVGVADGRNAANSTMQEQYRSALPANIKAELGGQ